MTEDLKYLVNYRPDTLYVHPRKDGAFAKVVGDSEELVGEIGISERTRIAVSLFYVNSRQDFDTVQLTKLQYHRRLGWREDGCIRVTRFQLAQVRDFLQLISGLDLSEAEKTRVSLGGLQLGSLGALLTSTKGREVLEQLARSPALEHDIYALAAKRTALARFADMRERGEHVLEPEWQRFFEENAWIFGQGLSVIALAKAAEKLETWTTGPAFDRSGKRTDALLRTRAEVSQFVLAEIKRSVTPLLRSGSTRPGCWGVSTQLSDAVAQVQKTAFEFGRERFAVALKDAGGDRTGEYAYAVQPRAYLVIGDTGQLAGNDDKVASFELFRRSMTTPEIVTFDELLCRAELLLENLDRAMTPIDQTESGDQAAPDDDVPF